MSPTSPLARPVHLSKGPRGAAPSLRGSQAETGFPRAQRGGGGGRCVRVGGGGGEWDFTALGGAPGPRVPAEPPVSCDDACYNKRNAAFSG